MDRVDRKDCLYEAALDVLVSIGLDNQTLTFEFFEYTLTIKMDTVTWVDNTKTLTSLSLTMPVASLSLTAGFTAKVGGVRSRKT